MLLHKDDLPEYIRQRFKTDYVWVEEWRDQRNYNQLKLFWLWMTAVGADIGETKEWCHDYFCANYPGLGIERVELSGVIISRVRGTKYLNTKQMAIFMGWIERVVIGALGWELPNEEVLKRKIEEVKNGK